MWVLRVEDESQRAYYVRLTEGFLIEGTIRGALTALLRGSFAEKKEVRPRFHLWEHAAGLQLT